MLSEVLNELYSTFFSLRQKRIWNCVPMERRENITPELCLHNVPGSVGDIAYMRRRPSLQAKGIGRLAPESDRLDQVSELLLRRDCLFRMDFHGSVVLLVSRFSLLFSPCRWSSKLTCCNCTCPGSSTDKVWTLSSLAYFLEKVHCSIMHKSFPPEV